MMKCERAVELLTRSAESAGNERWAAAEHADACGDCRAAVAAVHALRLARLASAPDPAPGAFERATAAATGGPAAERPPRRGFWAGLGLGAAIAVGAAVAAVVVMSRNPPAAVASMPRLALAVNEVRDVSISLTAPEALTDAEIRVELSGAIGLGGYEGRRELRWRANLEPGVNRLTLPVVATGVGGGQVLVEVLHDGKRRTFVVDVTAAG
jgi:hypothetical protein